MTETGFIDYLETPIGYLLIQASNVGIKKVIFVDELFINGLSINGLSINGQEHTIKQNEWTNACKLQLSEYFTGTRESFNLPLDQEGTLFQKEVWSNLSTIPFGKSTSYGEIAKQIQNPKAVRAVGAANGKNPISIIVPCHRVIGNNGKLTGYAGGLKRKAWLLNHENIHFI